MTVGRLHIDPASFDFAQDEVIGKWHIEFVLILSEVEGRTLLLPCSRRQ